MNMIINELHMPEEISDEDRISRIESYLDEMIRLTEELYQHNIKTGKISATRSHTKTDKTSS